MKFLFTAFLCLALLSVADCRQRHKEAPWVRVLRPKCNGVGKCPVVVEPSVDRRVGSKSVATTPLPNGWGTTPLPKGWHTFKPSVVNATNVTATNTTIGNNSTMGNATTTANVTSTNTTVKNTTTIGPTVKKSV